MKTFSLLLKNAARYACAALGLLFGPTIKAHAQDPQFSQPYFIKSLINPAMIEGNRKFSNYCKSNANGISGGFLYRRQFDAHYRTYAVTAVYQTGDKRDKLVDGYHNFAFALTYLRDEAEFTSITQNNFDAAVRYSMPIVGDWEINSGVQIGMHQKSIFSGDRLFPDQYNQQVFLPNNNSPSTSTDPYTDKSSYGKLYPNVDGGLLVYNKVFYLGGSIYHLNSPNISFSENPNNKVLLARALHAQLGYLLLPKDKSKWNTRLLLHYRSQTPTDQLDAGFRFEYRKKLWQLFGGGWYRGLPTKRHPDLMDGQQHDVLVALFGISGYVNNVLLSIGLSWDIQMHPGYPVGNTQELTLSSRYITDKCDSNKEYRGNPCPDH